MKNITTTKAGGLKTRAKDILSGVRDWWKSWCSGNPRWFYPFLESHEMTDALSTGDHAVTPTNTQAKCQLTWAKDPHVQKAFCVSLQCLLLAECWSSWEERALPRVKTKSPGQGFLARAHTAWHGSVKPPNWVHLWEGSWSRKVTLAWESVPPNHAP